MAIVLETCERRPCIGPYVEVKATVTLFPIRRKQPCSNITSVHGCCVWQHHACRDTVSACGRCPASLG